LLGNSPCPPLVSVPPCGPDVQRAAGPDLVPAPLGGVLPEFSGAHRFLRQPLADITKRGCCFLLGSKPCPLK
jgi:hypothetical protein